MPQGAAVGGDPGSVTGASANALPAFFLLDRGVYVTINDHAAPSCCSGLVERASTGGAVG